MAKVCKAVVWSRCRQCKIMNVTVCTQCKKCICCRMDFRAGVADCVAPAVVPFRDRVQQGQ